MMATADGNRIFRLRLTRENAVANLGPVTVAEASYTENDIESGVRNFQIYYKNRIAPNE